MKVLDVPLVAIGIVVTVLVFAFGVRRLLGLRLAPLRTLLAGLIAFFVAQPIISAIGGPAVRRGAATLPGLWFVLLGLVIALLIGMIFLVVSEALVPSGSLPGPVYLARSLRRQAGRTRRYAQITRVLVRRGLLPYQRGGRRSELATAEGRARLARSLRLALEDGGVTFVKLGQVLSTRRDLLPPEFITELSRLQDDAPQVPWPQVEATLRTELGAGVDEVFVTFEREPLAAASIAQVHRATLAAGRPVVVKVCRPGVRAVVDRDLDIVLRLAGRLQRGTSWGRSVGAVTLAHGFADALREELDLRIEARNMTAVAAAADRRGPDQAQRVRVPAPYQPLCGEKVLVMDYLDGRPLAAADAGLAAPARAALASSLLDTLLRQVLLDGTFHADPHPGNVLLLTDGGLGLLDFGSVGRIDAGLRSALQRLLLALDRGDPAALADALLDVVDRPEDLDQARLERALGRFAARHVGPGITPDVRMFTDLFRIVAEHGLAIPPEIAAVFRALATMEGTLTQLDPGFDIVAGARRFASGQFAERLGPDELRRTALDELTSLLTSLLPMLRRLPRRIDRVGHALETGRLSVNVRLLADPSDRRFVTGLLHQVLLTFPGGQSVRLFRLLPAGGGGHAGRPGAGPGLPPGHQLTSVFWGRAVSLMPMTAMTIMISPSAVSMPMLPQVAVELEPNTDSTDGASTSTPLSVPST